MFSNLKMLKAVEEMVQWVRAFATRHEYLRTNPLNLYKR